MQCGTNLRFLDPPPEGVLSGKTIAGSFLLEAQIGSGAMGAIYRARQLSLAKTVVVKLLHRHLLSDPTLSRRFHREARAASRLDHPNIINVIDFGQAEDGALFIAMEHVDGRDLAEVIYEEYPLGVSRIIRILKQVCLALDEAHVKGIIHRDLKPENIMIEQRRNDPDFVKVLDFGIAKIQDAAAEDGEKPGWQTVAGVVCGTPEYMAPEQARGDALDARSDLYALGVILYQMLTNTLPFVGDSPIAVVTRHLVDPLPLPSTRAVGVDPRLEALVQRLMQKRREDRPADAMAVYHELEQIEGGRVVTPASTARSEDVTRVVPADLVEEVSQGPVTEELVVGTTPSRWRLIGVAAVIVFAALSVVAWYLVQTETEREPRPSKPPVRASIAADDHAPVLDPPVAEPPVEAAAAEAPVGEAPVEPPVDGLRFVRSPEPLGLAAPARRSLEVVAAPEIVAERPRPAPRPPAQRAADERAAKAAARAAAEKAARAAAARDAESEKTEALAKALQEARDAKASGQWTKVIAAYSAAYKLRPLAGFLKELGRAHIKAGDKARGCEYLSRYLKRLPPDKRALDVQTLSFYRCDFSG